MKKKTNIKTVIRQIVREEVAMAIGEVVNELKQPSLSSPRPKTKKKVVEKKSYSKNSILNDVLNETAQDSDWETINDGTLTTANMNQVAYGDLMNNGQQATNPNDPMAKFLNKDYRKVLKATEEKSKTKRGL